MLRAKHISIKQRVCDEICLCTNYYGNDARDVPISSKLLHIVTAVSRIACSLIGEYFSFEMSSAVVYG